MSAEQFRARPRDPATKAVFDLIQSNATRLVVEELGRRGY